HTWSLSFDITVSLPQCWHGKSFTPANKLDRPTKTDRSFSSCTSLRPISFIIPLVPWPRGEAADCKSVDPGSNPGGTSSQPQSQEQHPKIFPVSQGVKSLLLLQSLHHRG